MRKVLVLCSIWVMLLNASPAWSEDVVVLFQLKDQQYGACLTADQSKAVRSVRCDQGGTYSQWYWTVQGLANAVTNECLSAEGPNALYRLEPCDIAAANRRGVFRADRFRLRAGAHCAAVNLGQRADATYDVRVESCGTDLRQRNQLWEYAFLASKTPFRILHPFSKKCLTASNDGSGMTIEACTTGAENFRQIWYYQKSGDKELLQNLATAKCATVSTGGRAWDGRVATSWDSRLDACGGADSSRQLVYRVGDLIEFTRRAELIRGEVGQFTCLRSDHLRTNEVRVDGYSCDRNGDARWTYVPINSEHKTAVTVRYVRAIRPAEGVGGPAKFMAGLAGALTVEVAFAAPEIVFGSNPVGAVALMMIAPVTDMVKEQLQQQATDLGLMALKKIDAKFSGTDQLYIKVNDQRLWDGNRDVKSGDKIDLNKRWPMDGQEFELELFETDKPLVFWSPAFFDDSMGGVRLTSTSSMEEYVNLIQGEDDSIYEISYVIQPYIP